MARALTALLLCTVCWSSTIGWTEHNQDPEQLTEVDLRVKGVGLGSSYAVLLRQTGRPVSSHREKIHDETCGPAHTSLELKYNGAVLELVGDLQGRDFKVVSFEVTSPRLIMSPGIKIGMSQEKAQSKLGTPWQISNESGFRILNYVTKGNDGGVFLYFRNGRLVKVYWRYTLC